MKKTIFIISLYSAFVFTGCATNQTAHKSASNVLKTNPNKYIINNLPLHYKVSIINYSSKFTNNLLHASVNIQNNDQKRYFLEYRFRWFDDSDFEVGKTPWLPLTLNAREFKSIQEIAHTPDAEKFKFYIREKQ